MAAVAAPMYGGHHQAFLPAAESASLEDPLTTLFCRALYDYDAQDASALSFRKDDIIEVLTQQPSGWWDGLLGDERGWFPSNYVTIISDEEAEIAFSGSELSVTDTDTNQDSESMVDMTRAMMQGGQLENEEWLENEISAGNGLAASIEGPAQLSDFWMPQVTSDGQIYYVNTHTGQHSRDLPQEADDDISDGDLAGLTSQSSSRSGTSAGLGLAVNGNISRSGSSQDLHNSAAGFGVPKRTGTPDPWVRKLADDGMSYYYWNKADGTVQWTRPETTQHRDRSASSHNLSSKSSLSDPSSSRLRSKSSVSQLHPSRSRVDTYSDDSDIEPQTARHPKRHLPIHEENVTMNLTSAERIAQSLQQALAPPPPELVTDLSNIARNSIQGIVDNIQFNGLTRRPEEDQTMDELVQAVVLSVRNLLYVAAVPTGHIPSSVLPRDARDQRSSHSPNAELKPAQRKVTATLSKLVLSARAMQYDSGSASSDTPNRIEGDAEELDRAVVSFVLEVQRSQTLPEGGKSKRLRGVFTTANVGLGLVGAGAAGSWKGFGWVSLDDHRDAPGRVLGTDIVSEMGALLRHVGSKFSALNTALRTQDNRTGNLVHLHSHNLITQVSAFLAFVANIHVARHVDIDGISQELGHVPNDIYTQTVERARLLVRTLEAAVQSIYDDSSELLLIAQSIRSSEDGQSPKEREDAYDLLDALMTALHSNMGLVQQTLEALLSIGHDQADMAQGDYNGSIEWRMSRLSVIDTQFGGSHRPVSPRNYDDTDNDNDNEDVVDMELAFRKQGPSTNNNNNKTQDPDPSSLYRNIPSSSEGPFNTPGQSGFDDFAATDDDMVGPESPDLETESILDETSTLFDDELASVKSPPKAAGARKLRKLLGDEAPQHYLNAVDADSKPWYLRPNYDQTEILIDPDGGVRGGTVPALVERLTAHEHGDPTFIKTFLMTYKSFTTLDELFNLLVQRFWIQPPPKLAQSEYDEWVKLKQHVIQMRVLNTFKSMVVDDDVLEKEDLYILDRMKEFISSEAVNRFAAAKQLMILIERAQRGGDGMIKTLINTGQQAPPAPIIPKTSKKLKLLDIDPLELARQLTILESGLYQKIRPMECLRRSREQKDDHNDNIATVIKTSNRIADWVADSILCWEDSRKRAAALKQFISVADRCRTLHNYSTMIAITSGLNTPPIHRLKRTWEQVNQKFMAQLAACVATLDSTRNFNNYRSTMANVSPPCVPFIGVFLTTLQFIQDGGKDNLPGNLVNFRKRQKASEVIQDIKRWQSMPFNFTPVPLILSYIEESLGQYNDVVDVRDHFWNISLEREPREREDEKMARLLQESGFL